MKISPEETMRLNMVTAPIIVLGLAVLFTFVPDLSGRATRKKLGEITADLTGDGRLEKILKIKINDGNSSKIVLEVYVENRLLRTIVLPEAKDAMFTFKNSRNNMFAADIDNDGKKDILTISRNDRAESKLSVLTYKNGTFTTRL